MTYSITSQSILNYREHIYTGEGKKRAGGGGNGHDDDRGRGLGAVGKNNGLANI